MQKTTWFIIAETAIICILCFILFQQCNKKITVNNSKGDSIQADAKIKDSLWKIKHAKDSATINQLQKKDSASNAKYLQAQATTANQSSKIIALIADVNKLKHQGTDSLQNAIDSLIDSQIQLLADIDNQKQQADLLLNDKDSLIDGLISALSDATSQVDSVVEERNALYKEFQVAEKTEAALVKQKKLNNLWAKVSTVALVVVGLFAAFKH